MRAAGVQHLEEVHYGLARDDPRFSRKAANPVKLQGAL
jgi:hypothetical protein